MVLEEPLLSALGYCEATGKALRKCSPFTIFAVLIFQLQFLKLAIKKLLHNH